MEASSTRRARFAEKRGEHGRLVKRGPEHCRCALLDPPSSYYVSLTRHPVVAFAESKSGPRHIPITLSRPTARLAGHRSIVNTALMHPTFPAILTAGIERNILLHSPTPATPFMPSSSLSVTPAEVRTLPAEETPESRLLASRARGTTLTIWDDEPEDDSMSIALFDQCVPSMFFTCLCHLFDCRILRQESGADVFETRRWSVEEDDDEDEDEDEAEDRDETEDEDDEDEDMYETMAYVDAT